MLGHHADAFLKSRWLVRESLRALRYRSRTSAHARACRRVAGRGRGRACHIARRSARCPADAKARRPRRRWPPRCARPCVARPLWAAAESRFRPTTDRRPAAGAIYHRTAETAASETRRMDRSGRPAEPGRGPRSHGISRAWSRRSPSKPWFPPLTYGLQSIPRAGDGTTRKAHRGRRPRPEEHTRRVRVATFPISPTAKRAHSIGHLRPFLSSRTPVPASPSTATLRTVRILAMSPVAII